MAVGDFSCPQDPFQNPKTAGCIWAVAAANVMLTLIIFLCWHREVQQATTAPAQCDGDQKNIQKAQQRGWVSYNSDSPSVWLSDLCFKGRRLENQIEGNAQILQMVAALSWLAFGSCHSSLISACHIGAKGLCLWCMEPHQSRSGLALAGEYDGSVSTLLVPGPTTMSHSCFVILFWGNRAHKMLLTTM